MGAIFERSRAARVRDGAAAFGLMALTAIVAQAHIVTRY